MANHFNQLIENDDDMSSSSIDRNERYDQYSTMNSPYSNQIDGNNNSQQLVNKNYPQTQEQQPHKTSLKLVLKRQANNNYQITNPSERLLLPTAAVTSPNTNNRNDVNTTVRTRPKRAASHKVKFRFSEEESDSENGTAPARKRAKLPTKTVVNSNLRKTSQTQARSIQPITKPKQQRQLQRATARNQPQPQPSQNLIPYTFEKPNRNQIKSQPQPACVQASRPFKPLVEEPLKETIIEFSRNEIVNSSAQEKLNAFDSKPLVLIERSKPLAICLCEDKTNIVCTKALLFIHLFQTLSAPCIGCPLCKIHLNINEFSKHIHPSEDDDEDSDNESRSKIKSDDDSDMDFDNDDDSRSTNSKTKPKKSYKILPYAINNNQLKDTDLKTWKVFCQRYSDFKQQKQLNKNNSSIQNPQSPLTNVNNNTSTTTTITTTTTTTTSTGNKEEIVEKESSAVIKEKAQFNDWDYVNTNEKLYMITNQSLQSDKVIYLNKNGEHISLVKRSEKNSQVGLFRQDSDDLDLSETESEDAALSMSGDECECVTSKVEEASIVINKENQTKIIEPTATEYNYAKPTLTELYFNMYDNSSKDKLFYIVDNQYTIVPDSYIVYINRKREIYFQQLKLASSVYFQKKWLNQSLDLEFQIN